MKRKKTRRLQTIASLLFLCTGTLLHAQIQFEQVLPPPPAPQNMADFEGMRYGDIVIADLDGDGDQDIIFTGENGNGIKSTKLYANDGFGNFSEVLDTPFQGASFSSISIADIDGDDDLDIIISGIFNLQSISKLYINQGDLIFTESTDPLPLPDVVHSIGFADIDGDGDQDLVAGLNSMYPYLNDGNGNFSVMANNFFGEFSNGSYAFGDIDGDGDLDFLASGTNASLQNHTKLFTNDGLGNFTEVVDTPFPDVSYSSTEFSDIDGDGDLDLLICGISVDQGVSTPLAQLFLNDGNGNYEQADESPFQALWNTSVSFVDIDNDGDQDVFIGGENDLNQGIMKFYSNDGFGNFIEEEIPFEWTESSAVAFGDIDGDGDLDIVFASGGPATAYTLSSLYINEGDLIFNELNYNYFHEVSNGSVGFSDVDGDGDQDVLITGMNRLSQASAVLYLNNGSAVFNEAIETPFDAVAYSAIAFCDVDADGDSDVLITGQDSEYQLISKLYLNDGTGSYTEVSDSPFVGVYSGSVNFADVDGDGDQDVLITGEASIEGRTAKLYLNDGSGNFTEQSETSFDGVIYSAVAFADIDSDGDQDVIISGYNDFGQPETKLYSNDGTGNFTEVIGAPFVAIVNGSIGFADVDGDGDFDVLITGQTDDTPNAKLYINDGNGNFTESVDAPFEAVLNSAIAFIDIDFDNDLDVLITGELSMYEHKATLYINDGLGNYSELEGMPFEGVGHGDRRTSLAFADADGDEDLDLLITGANVVGQYISKYYKNTSCIALAKCNPDTLTLSPQSTATLTIDDINNASSVTCGTPMLSLSQTDFDWSHIGENTVTLTVEDEIGNTATCEALVTILPPTDGFPSANVVALPDSIEIEEGESFILTLRIEPESDGQVSAADVAMSFNPELLQVTSLSLAPGTLLDSPSEPATFDNDAGTLFVGGFGVLPANTAFDHVEITFQAISSGITAVEHISEGFPSTSVSFAGLDITGLSPAITVTIGSGAPPDCAGIFGGTAFIDLCENCVGGTTGLEPCVEDCAGDLGGTASIDPCAICSGGNTGIEPCVEDCAGVFGGTASIDACNVCSGGDTGIEPNASCEGSCYATEVVEYLPGIRVIGGPLPANRTQSSQALGEPEGTFSLVFATLGYNGSITLAFDGPLPNDDGPDLEVVETSFADYGCDLYPEYADVYLSQNGTDFFYAHTVCKFDSLVEIDDAGQGFEYITHVKIVNNNVLTTTFDGFDLDGVRALHNCGDGFAPDDDDSGGLTVAIIAQAQSLLTSHPNPSSGISTVSFKTPFTSFTRLDVFDMTGRNMTTIFQQVAMEGEQYQFNFDGTSLANGVYIYRLTTDTEVLVEKFIIAR